MSMNRDLVSNLIDHLKGRGVDTAQTHLVATVALVPSGERDHWRGGQVKVFSPVAVCLEFVQARGTVDGVQASRVAIAIARFEADAVKRSASDSSLLEAADFNRHVRLEGDLAGVEALAPAAGTLMRELVDKHREITGVVSAAYEHIEVDPSEICRITSKRFTLEIGLERLAKYLDLDSEWFELLCEAQSPETEARFQQIGFEKLMLKQGFIDQPCSQDLYNDLRREFSKEGYSTSMDFMDYYQWFRRSEAKLGSDGRFTSEARATIVPTLRRWHADGKEDYRESARYWASRNFKVHPRHRKAVDLLIDEVIAEAEQGTT